MRLPHDLSGADLIRRLAKLGYQPTRLLGGHVRLNAPATGGHAHDVTLSSREPMRIGVLAAILCRIAEARGLTRDDVLKRLFD